MSQLDQRLNSLKEDLTTGFSTTPPPFEPRSRVGQRASIALCGVLVLVAAIGVSRRVDTTGAVAGGGTSERQMWMFEQKSMAMHPTATVGSRWVVSTPSNTPGRGDLVVVRLAAGDPLGMRRVIGLPGETVVVVGLSVEIDGQLLDEPYAAKSPEADMVVVRQPPVKLDAEHYFVMGDERAASRDSRIVGPIPSANIVASVEGPLGDQDLRTLPEERTDPTNGSLVTLAEPPTGTSERVAPPNVSSTFVPSLPFLPSVSCTFSEPNLVVLVSPEGVRIPHGRDNELVSQTLPTSFSGSIDTQFTVAASTPNGPATLTVTKGENLDDGGLEWQYTHGAELTTTNGKLTGGCSMFPQGMVPRVVVARDHDPFILREKPDLDAAGIVPISIGQILWVRPPAPSSTDEASWVEAMTNRLPVALDGTVDVVSGWVRHSHLSPQSVELFAAPASETGYQFTVECHTISVSVPLPPNETLVIPPNVSSGSTVPCSVTFDSDIPDGAGIIVLNDRVDGPVRVDPDDVPIDTEA